MKASILPSSGVVRANDSGTGKLEIGDFAIKSVMIGGGSNWQFLWSMLVSIGILAFVALIIYLV